MDIPKELGRPEFNPDKAYVPFPVAVERKVIDLDDLALNTPEQAAMAIANGCAPQHCGSVWFPGQGLGAIDIQAYRLRGNGRVLEVLPNSKQIIDAETREIRDASAAVVFMPNGLVRLTAVVLSIHENLRGWPARRQRCRVGGIANRGSVEVNHLGSEVTDYEMHDIVDGVVVARRRRPQFAMSVWPL